MEGVYSAEVIIDNGPFGVHKIRFETGRLARLAGGSSVVYLDDETMVLSTTTASKQPREGYDFFPLTVDVEERMYAAGRIPGSFFRREGRPSEDAILTCRLIDRPLRPSFVHGLRNEVQVVETIMALHPEHLYDVVAINAASLSTQLSGPAVLRPDRRGPGRADPGPVGGLPDPPAAGRGHLRHGGRRPGARGRRGRDHDGRGRVHAEHARAAGPGRQRGRRADRGDRGRGPGGGQAVHPGAVPGPVGGGPGGRQAGARVPDLRRLRPGRLRRRRRRCLRRAGPGPGHRVQAGPRERDRPGQGPGHREARGPVRGAREGDQRGLPGADQEAGPAADHP